MGKSGSRKCRRQAGVPRRYFEDVACEEYSWPSPAVDVKNIPPRTLLRTNEQEIKKLAGVGAFAGDPKNEARGEVPSGRWATAQKPASSREKEAWYAFRGYGQIFKGNVETFSLSTLPTSARCLLLHP